MTSAPLSQHVSTRSLAIDSIEVGIDWAADNLLRLRYVMSGDIGKLKIANPTAPTFADDLWRHTCCEVFVGTRNEASYYEFNFSTSGEWAAYRFDAYREGMHALRTFPCPGIQVSRNHREFELTSSIALDSLLSDRDRTLLLAASAVVEDEQGTISYWALTHPAAKPDFHHRDGFTFELTLAAGGGLR